MAWRNRWQHQIASLRVISDGGEVMTRCDERMLSSTKISYMYAPGSAPVTFDVDGVSFGCAPGMEATFPEVLGEYERLGVDCVLLSTHGPGTPANSGPFALQARAHAAASSYWVSYGGRRPGRRRGLCPGLAARRAQQPL